MAGTPLGVGDTAPDFTLSDQYGRPVSLRELRGADTSDGGRGVILFFYPAAMTPGCTTEACDFRDSLAPLQAAGYATDPMYADKLTRIIGGNTLRNALALAGWQVWTA